MERQLLNRWPGDEEHGCLIQLARNCFRRRPFSLDLSRCFPPSRSFPRRPFLPLVALHRGRLRLRQTRTSFLFHLSIATRRSVANSAGRKALDRVHFLSGVAAISPAPEARNKKSLHFCDFSFGIASFTPPPVSNSLMASIETSARKNDLVGVSDKCYRVKRWKWRWRKNRRQKMTISILAR